MAAIINSMPIEKRKGISGRHIITCVNPSTESHNALPTGNGIMKLSTMGQPECDIIVIEREELMSPQWETPPKAPQLANHLDRIRKLILNKEYKKAAEMADMAAAQSGTPFTLTANPSHPAIMLNINQPVMVANNYINTLNMRTSLITTQWDDEDGHYVREMFCSRADNVAVVRITAPKGHLNMTLRGMFPELDYKREEWTSNDIPNGRSGLFDCLPIPPEVTITHTLSGICLSGVYEYNRGGFSTAVRTIVNGGSVNCSSDSIAISNADSVLLLIGCRRNYHNQPEGDDQRLLDELGKLPADFDLLLKRHVDIHQPMFDRLSVDLGGDPDDYLLSTIELKRKQFLSKEIIPAYMEAMVDMGRFFLLSECGKFPPIYGHVNVNVNLQVSSGNIANLPEMMESFFRWIEWQLPDARENAERILGARGFFIACHPDEESGNLLHFNEYWPHHFWISSSGWCLNPFLEHYYCTGDEEFLRERVLPLYRELALLYEDFLTIKDENGKYVFVPSYSPENFPANINVMAVKNATMDISVCREVLTTLLKYGPQADIGTPQEYEKWENMLECLPDYLTGKYGELKEWACHEYEERYDHRHSSHLYGAYPGDEIQPELDEDLYRAAFISNRMRALGNESCHGIMHRALAAARLKDPWLVQKMLRFTLESGYVNDNFTTAHNPYTKHVFPDGQGGLPTILLESLIYSRPGFLELLPALPQECFQKGSLRGMAARTFAHIDEFTWDMDSRQMKLVFTPLKDQDITLCYRGGIEGIEIKGAHVKAGQNANYYELTVRENEQVVINLQAIK
ncbi:MAG: glycoside hydrolase N-terminal domain-containing protein [Caldicoprobacterales bacterium]